MGMTPPLSISMGGGCFCYLLAVKEAFLLGAFGKEREGQTEAETGRKMCLSGADSTKSGRKKSFSPVINRRPPS